MCSNREATYIGCLKILQVSQHQMLYSYVVVMWHYSMKSFLDQFLQLFGNFLLVIPSKEKRLL